MALSARLGIQDQSEYIDLLILKEFARSRSARQGASQKLKKEKGRYSYSKSVFSKDIQSINWDHLCVVEVLQKPHSVEELARRFNQTTPYINSILSDARRIGLVSQLTNGMWKALDFSRLFEGPGASATLRRLHYQFLDKARRNAEVCAFEDRELNSSLVLLTSEQVQAVRKLVRKFAREVLAEGSDQNNSKLYGLGIQLFPIEKLGD